MYNLVSEMVEKELSAGNPIPKVGLIVDNDRPGYGHLQFVVAGARVSTRPELLNTVDLTGQYSGRPFGGWYYRKVALQRLSLDKKNYLSESPIVNFSVSGSFTISTAPSFPYLENYITYQDILDAGAIIVTSAGNQRYNSGGVYPDFYHQYVGLSAVQEIHEKTGSILIVAGLRYGGDPVTNEKGFHRGYIGDKEPFLHPRSVRCGDTMEYCVAAPFQGTSFASPMVAGTLMSLRYVWPHLTNQQLVRLACVTAVDLGDEGIDPVYGCGQFSVSDIWQPTGQLVEDPIAEFSLDIAEGAMQLSGASFGETVTVAGYENNEFARDYQIAVPASSSPTSLSIEPTISWDSVNTMLEFRNNGSLSLPVANGRGSAAHLFKDTFLFFKEANRGSAIGLSHASGLSVAFERETDSFFGSIGSGSYEFGDTNKFVASFDRQFNLNETYGVGVKLAAAYGEMEPDISLIKSAKGTAQTAQVAFVRKRNNFESRLEMNYNTGLKGTVSIQNTDYRLKPRSETAVMLKMRFGYVSPK